MQKSNAVTYYCVILISSFEELCIATGLLQHNGVVMMLGTKLGFLIPHFITFSIIMWI